MVLRLTGRCDWAGISLQADQWESLVGATADIDAELQAFGAPSTTKPKESAGNDILLHSAAAWAKSQMNYDRAEF